MTRPKFIIWAYPFDLTIGGHIVLHLLCGRLNELGETALIWQADRPPLGPRPRWRDYLRALRYRVGRTKRTYRRDPFDNPVAGDRDLAGAIVIYPEIVAGNPLGARTVVRWLLHRPGYHTGHVRYGPDDLLFVYQEAFDDPETTGDRASRLTLTWFHEAYRQKNHGPRSGSAYLLRKGKDRPLAHDMAGSILVDDLSHEQTAAVFNRVERFYCYDLYTMYALYAALCGCLPIVVPDPDLTKEAWVPDERDRYGIAYGEDDLDWARATRPKLLERVAAVRADQDAMLRAFVDRCLAAHGSGASSSP